MKSPALASLAAAIEDAANKAPPRAPPAPDMPPDGLTAKGRQRWYVERQIRQLSASLALLQTRVDAGDASALTRMSTLNTSLRDWLDKLDEIGEGGEEDPHEHEAQRWAAAAARARKKIDDGLAMARERMGALLGRPFPYAADVGADRPAASASRS